MSMVPHIIAHDAPISTWETITLVGSGLLSLAAAAGLAWTLSMRRAMLRAKVRADKESDRARELAAILESTPDIVGIATPDGKTRYLNHAAREFFGLTDRSVSGIPVDRYQPKLMDKLLLDKVLPEAARVGAWVGDTTVIRHDGAEVPARQLIHAHRGVTGEVTAFSTIIHDVTSLRQAEHAATTALRRLELSHGLDRLALEGGSPAALAARVVDELAAIIPGVRATYATIDGSSLAAVCSAGGDGMPDLAGQSRRLEGATGYVERLRGDRPIVINDVDRDETLGEMRETFAAWKSRAIVCAPLREGAELTGIVSVASATPRAWTKDETDAVRAAADGLAVALGAARDWEKQAETLRRVTRSEEAYRLLFRENPQSMWVYDVKTLRFLDVNDAALRAYGYSREEFLGFTLLDIRPVEDQAGLADLIKRAVSARRSMNHSRHICKDGTVMEVETIGSEATFFAPQARLVVVQDITARVRAERLREGYADALRKLAEDAPLAQVLDGICRSVEAQASGVRCSILLASADGTTLRSAAAPSLPKEFCDIVNGLPIAEGVGCCGTAAARRETVISSDIATDSLWSSAWDVAARFGLGACWSMPMLTSRGELLGTFAVYRGVPAVPTEEEIAVLTGASDLACLAVLRRRAEDSLRESETRYELALRATSDGLWDWEVESGVALWSHRFCELLGVEWKSRRPGYDEFMERMHPGDLERVREAVRMHLELDEPYDVEFRLRTEYGYRWFRSRGQATRNEAGRPVRMAGTLQDVTERRDLEGEMKGWQRRYEAAVSASRQLLYDWNTTTGEILWGGDSEKMLGCALGSLGGLDDWASRIVPEDRARVDAAIDRVLKDDAALDITYRMHRADGSEIHVQDTGRLLPPDAENGAGTRRMIGFMTDITDHVLASEDLRHTKDSLERLLSSASSVLLAQSEQEVLREAAAAVHGAGWRAVVATTFGEDWSLRGCETMGLTPEQEEFIKGGWTRNNSDRAAMFGPERDRFRIGRSYFIPSEENSMVMAHEIQIFPTPSSSLQEGEWREEDVFYIPLMTNEGRVVGRLMLDAPADGRRPSLEVVRYIESFAALAAHRIESLQLVAAREAARKALREREEQLLQAQKMEAVGQLASGVAHDLNNLLTAIRGYVSLAGGTLPDDHPALESLEQVEEASRQAAGVANSLLTFSRRGKTEKGPVRLAPVVEAAARLARRAMPPGVSLVVDTARGADLWVNADDTQLQQVVLNLALNARDAVDGTGEVQIAVEPPAQPGGCAVLSVRDNGPGISPDVRARLFEPFFTTKPRGSGTGLGLAVVHSLVTDHGGQIEVLSGPEIGTTFLVEMPTCERPQRLLERSGISRGRAPGAAAMIVEPNALVRGLLSSMLVTLGYDTSGVADGAEARQTLSHERRRFEVIVANPAAPGLDMPRLTALARAKGVAPRTVLVVARDHEFAAPPGVVLLRKPFQLADLRRALEQSTVVASEGVD